MSASVAVASYGLPQLEVSHAELLALSALEPSCSSLALALKSRMTDVGMWGSRFQTTSAKASFTTPGALSMTGRLCRPTLLPE